MPCTYPLVFSLPQWQWQMTLKDIKTLLVQYLFQEEFSSCFFIKVINQKPQNKAFTILFTRRSDLYDKCCIFTDNCYMPYLF